MQKLFPPLLVLVLLSSCSPKLDSDKKRVSYAIGQQVAANIKQSSIEVDVDVLNRSIKDGLTNKKSELSEAELQQAVATMQNGMQKKTAEEGEKNRSAGIKFLEQNRQKPGVKVTASGLQFEVLKEGSGKKPASESTVVVQYHGTLLNDSVFDSTKVRGAPAELKVNGIVQGLKEGLPLMKEGAKYKFYLPPELAYGAQERPGIPAHSTLVFEIELLKVK